MKKRNVLITFILTNLLLSAAIHATPNPQESKLNINQNESKFLINIESAENTNRKQNTLPAPNFGGDGKWPDSTPNTESRKICLSNLCIPYAKN